MVAAGYQHAEYEYFASSDQRTDHIFYIHPSVGMDITTWLACEVGAEYRQNDSSQERTTFSETTAYFQVNVFF